MSDTEKPTEKLKVKRLTAQKAVKLWEDFYQSYGAAQMKRSYGWLHAPETLYRRGERVYSFSTGGKVIGWGSVELRTWDALDDEAFCSSGVFKEEQRKGYGAEIMAWLVEKAKSLGADFASRSVNKDNEEHYQRVMRIAYTEGTGWIHAGDTWWPIPGHGYFVYPFGVEDAVQRSTNASEPSE